MAKDIDLTKKVSDETPDDTDVTPVKEDKPAKTEKSDKGAKSKADKLKRGKKPKKGIVKYFKDARSEFKKVVWPAPKQTTHNTIVVIIMCVLSAIFIFGIDTLFGLLNKLLLGQG